MLLLEPHKQFITLLLYYVIDLDDNKIIHFPKNQQELKVWEDQGYVLSDAFNENIHNKDKIIETLETKWRRLTWGEHNQILSQCRRFYDRPNQQAGIEIDFVKYQELKMKLCLKSWNILDENGKIAELTEENIDKLPPEVAKELIDRFDKITDPTSDDIKELGRLSKAFFEGKLSKNEEIPGYVLEHIVARNYGWDLKYIREDLDYVDFRAHVQICTVYENIEREFRMSIMGIDPKGKSKPTKRS